MEPEQYLVLAICYYWLQEPSVTVLGPAGIVRRGKGYPGPLEVEVFLSTEPNLLRLCICGHGGCVCEGTTLLPCPLHEAASCLMQGSLIDPSRSQALADFSLWCSDRTRACSSFRPHPPEALSGTKSRSSLCCDLIALNS